MNLYTLFFRYRFVFGFSPEGEHKVRPYIGFGHWLGFGFCLRQHFPLAFTYAHSLTAHSIIEPGIHMVKKNAPFFLAKRDSLPT